MANPDVLSTRIADSIAVVTLGSAKRVFFDQEMSKARFDALTELSTNDAVRVIVVTGGAPGFFIRHYSVAELIRMGQQVQASGRKWPEDQPYTAGVFDQAMTL